MYCPPLTVIIEPVIQPDSSAARNTTERAKRLDIGTSISTDGDTSEFYAGLTWDVFLTGRLFLEGSAGGALQTGDDRAFGCTASFRESGSVGVTLSQRWDMLATVDHMSNANLCDKNRGLTQVGIHFGRK